MLLPNRDSNYTPCEQKALLLALRALLRFAQRSRSNLRRLADKQACRLGFARLSAPPPAMRAATQSQRISLSPPKNKKPPKWAAFFGGEREIRTLAPVSRPTPLAGEPLHRLGYFSVPVTLVLYHNPPQMAREKILNLCEQDPLVSP